jgi:hypothetical protein
LAHLDPDDRTMLRALVLGVVVGVVYGLLVRWVAGHDDLLAVMTLAFVVLVPLAMGFATMMPNRSPTPGEAIFLPWIAVALGNACALVIGWEGVICVVLLTPAMLVMSSFGGLIAYALRRSKLRDAAGALVVLPFAVGPLESRFEPPVDVRRVTSQIEIDAAPDVVWSQIESVPEIRPDEQPPALYLAIGFPRPLSAVIDRPGAGGVREARFEGGVLFLEKVTDWQPGRRLSFTIDAQEHLIPPTTLDEHVTIGGPYFDVLTGTYEIEPLENGRVRLHLASELRVSTNFNFYAGWWADVIMGSIQENILEIVKARAEPLAAAPRPR